MPEQDKRWAAEEASTVQRAKKPYVRPTLRRLGSVRDLTLGSGPSPHPDGPKQTRRPTAM